MEKNLLGIFYFCLISFSVLAAESFQAKKNHSSIQETQENNKNLTEFHEENARLQKMENEKFNQEFQHSVVETMRQNGASPDRIASVKERFQVDNANVQLKNWGDWTNYYKARIFSPPIIFDMCEQFKYDFTEPVGAFRSYMVASAMGDAKTMLQCADDSQFRFLKKMGVDPLVKGGTYALTNVMTTQVVLMTATTKLEDKEYALVFFRSQDKSNPKNGSIGLHAEILVLKNGKYYVTMDLDDSYFGNVLSAAHADGSMIWKYPEFLSLMQKSQFPTNFYHIK